MTLAELSQSPIGTTVIKISHDVAAGRWFATHYEKQSGAIKPVNFYAETEEEARGLAEAHDKKLKEKLERWKRSASARRRDAIGKM